MDLQKELEEKLVKIKGKVAHVPNARKDLPKWLDRGKLFDSEHVIIEEGKFGLCEENSAKFYWKNRNNDKGMQLCKGFAYNGKSEVWHYHAWCIDKDGIIHECTPEKRDGYYGYVLTREEAEQLKQELEMFGTEFEEGELAEELNSRDENSSAQELDVQDIGKRVQEAQKDNNGKKNMANYLGNELSKNREGDKSKND